MRLRRTASPTMRAAIANPRRGSGRAGVAREYREQSVGGAARITIDAIEFGFLPEALRRFERPCGRLASTQVERVRARVARASSDRQTLATLRAAPGENLTTRTGGHAGAKAVSALAMQIAGLVSALHAGSRDAKVALKQAHGGPKRRAARVRSEPLSVKRETRVGASDEDRSEKSFGGLWITRGRIGIDSPSFSR